MHIAKLVKGLQSFGECVLTTSKRVGGLQTFECAFWPSLQRFGRCVLDIPKASEL